MTLALIVLIVFLIVWLNQKADIQKKKNQRSEFIDITPRVLPKADTDLASQTFNKWFKKISSEIDADSFPENYDNFIMFDLVSKYYKKYNVPNYSRYDTIGTQNQRIGMRRAQAKKHDEKEIPTIKDIIIDSKSDRDKENFYVWYLSSGVLYGCYNALSLGSQYVKPKILLHNRLYDEIKPPFTDENSFIEWVRKKEIYQYSIIFWGTSSEIKQGCYNWKWQSEKEFFLYQAFNPILMRIKEKYHTWLNSEILSSQKASKKNLEHINAIADDFCAEQRNLTNTQKIYLLPETLAYFVELIHQCTRKELKEQGWDYEYKSGITYGLDICQIQSPITGRITNMSTPLVADEKWEAEMKARKAYKEQFPWDD